MSQARSVVAFALVLAGTAKVGFAQDVVLSPREWTLNVSAYQSRESNLRFQVPDDSGDVVTGYTGKLTGALVSERGRIGISIGGGSTLFQRETGFNTFTYDVGIEAKRDLTQRWKGYLTAQARTILSSEAQAQNVAQPLLPLSLSRDQTASAGTSYRFSPRTTGLVDGSYTRVTFDSPLLIGGWTAGGKTSIEHLYSPTSSVGLLYGLEENSTFGVRVGVHTLFAEWRSGFGPIGTRVFAGAMRIDPIDGLPARVKPAGSAELFSSLTGGVLDLTYGRSAAQAFGLGRMLVSDRVSLSYDRASFLGNSIHMGVDRSWSRNPNDESVAFVSTAGNLEINRTLLSGFYLGADASMRIRDQSLIVRDNSIKMVLGFARTSRK
jgi:hypothetical protein